MRLPESLAPLRIVAFRRFLGARLATLLGNAIAPIALVFAVIDISDSPSAVGLVLAARSVPIVVFLLFGGVLADRLPRRAVLVVAHIACFATQAVAAALLLAGVATVWQLAVIEAINGTAAAFTFPAVVGIVPDLVPRADLQRANALSSMTRNVASIGGASAGGAIVALLGSGVGILIDAVTFGIAAILLARLPLEHIAAKPSAGASFLRDLREGWSEFVSRRWVWVIVLAFGFLNAIHSGAVPTLGPVIADATFGRAGWGFVLAAESTGLLIGTVVMLRFRPRRPMLAGMIGMLGMVPMIAVLGARPEVGLLIPLALIAGVGISIFGVSWETAVQTHVPRDKLSRVFSYDALGSFVAIPVGQVIAGPLAEAYGSSRVITYAAAAYGVLVLATIADGSVRRLSSGEDAPSRTR